MITRHCKLKKKKLTILRRWVYLTSLESCIRTESTRLNPPSRFWNARAEVSNCDPRWLMERTRAPSGKTWGSWSSAGRWMCKKQQFSVQRITGKDPDRWERQKARGERGDRGRDGWTASPTRWTWVWVNSAWRAAVHGVAKRWTRLSDWTAKFWVPSTTLLQKTNVVLNGI